jgi:hypothetical protein
VKLIAYLPEGDHIDIRPAPVERPWMEATDQRFAYRCLPLNVTASSVAGAEVDNPNMRA